MAAGYLQFNWKDGKSNHADILSKLWELQVSGPSRSPYSSGREIQVSSLSRQREVTEFQLKRRSLSLTLTDQGWTNNPNVTPSGTQQNSGICFAW